MPKPSPSNYVAERIESGRNAIIIGLALIADLVLFSIRGNLFTSLGVIASLLIVLFGIANYFRASNMYLRMRAKYIMFFIVLSIFTYLGSRTIPPNDAQVMYAIGQSLVTATSISAVFAVTIYEKLQDVTVRNKSRISRELKDIAIRLAVYPILVSVLAVFSSVLILVFSSSFLFSIILLNITVTFILLTLITSVELLKEDLMRSLD